MKIDGPSDSKQAHAPAKEAFANELKKAAPPAHLPAKASSAHPAQPIRPGRGQSRFVHVEATARATTARVEAQAKVEGRVQARSFDVKHDHERLNERVHSLIARELERTEEKKDIARQPALQPAPAPQGTATQATRLTATEAPKVRAAEAIALVQKIEVFLKTSRPSLSLTLTGRFAGEVQIERTKKGEVALKLKPNGARPSPSDLQEISDELEGRGLKLSDVRFV